MLDDPRVGQASEKFVCVIVRRPHAYRFLEKDQNVSIPGIVFLDGEGDVLGSARLESAEQLVEKMSSIKQGKAER